MLVPSHADCHPKVLLLLVYLVNQSSFKKMFLNMIVTRYNVSFMLCPTQPSSPPVNSGVGLNLDGVLFAVLYVLM